MNDAGQDSVEWLRMQLAPGRLAALLALVDGGTISGPTAKDVFEKAFGSAASPAEIVKAEGLAQIDDETQLAALVADIVRRNQDAVGQYRSGKTNALGFLVGQVMKAAAGKANPKRVNELLRRDLESAV